MGGGGVRETMRGLWEKSKTSEEIEDTTQERT
jgi:hypothetical protein